MQESIYRPQLSQIYQVTEVFYYNLQPRKGSPQWVALLRGIPQLLARHSLFIVSPIGEKKI